MTREVAVIGIVLIIALFIASCVTTFCALFALGYKWHSLASVDNDNQNDCAIENDSLQIDSVDKHDNTIKFDV